MNLRQFGIYTNKDSLRIIIEEDNDEIFYFHYPVYIFETTTLTNEHINNILDLFIIENSNLNWSFVFSKSKYGMDMDNFAYIGEVKKEETKDRLLYEVNEAKHKF